MPAPHPVAKSCVRPGTTSPCPTLNKPKTTMKTPSYRSLARVATPLALTLTLLLPASLRAIDPDLPFSSGSTGADGPLTFREIAPGRNSHALAYDAARQEVVLFGGYNGNSMGDTWVLSGNNWVRRLPATSPVDRWGHRMVFDAARGEIVLFGGTRNTGRLNDTWVWNGTTWTQKTPASSPSPRENFCFAYDAARQRVVLFGGANGGQETWLWDGVNWTAANPANRPQATDRSAMAYDPVRQEIVMFGNYGQTWIWNGTDWTQRGSFNVPSAKSFPTLVQDGASNTILMFSGSNQQETWRWDGANWTSLTPPNSPSPRQYHAMVWANNLQRGVMFGGDIPGVDNYAADTWFWNGTDWSWLSGKVQNFNAKARPNGIWNFTSINIPAGVTVRFGIETNLALPPIRWLATEDVVINGTIDVSGQFAANDLPPGQPARGGPGGFDGGLGGVRFASSASYVGQPGKGPGGGDPGTAQQTNPNLRDGKPGEYNGNYGNVFLQPLLGGSGGGGGASNNDWDGGRGGGGGGAIMIASSRDILLNGVVRANGGEYQWSNASYGGRGSGGAILLRADRITGPGSLEAYGGNQNNPNGRIRVEAYARTLTGGQNPPAVVGLPSTNGDLNQAGTLSIVSVKGVNVVQPPTGNLLTPDVVFSDAGPVNVVVNGTGIPNGTPVQLRVTTATSVIQSAPQNLQNGTATLTVTVPKGLGTLQATAQYNQ